MKDSSKRFYTRTMVRSLRAEKEFFDKCSLVAKREETNVNELIVRVVSEYIKKKGK